MKKLSQIIKDEIDAYSKSVEVSPGNYCDWHSIVKRIKLYKVDKYLERNDTAVFWNIGTPLAPHFKKLIDTDIKDYKPRGIGETNYVQAWILGRKLESWARESGFGFVLNDVSSGLTDFGFHSLKLVPDKGEGYKLESIDLSKFYFDITAKDFCDTPKIEIHELDEHELREKDDVWDNIEEALKKAEKTNGTQENKDSSLIKYKIYEREGYYRKEGWKRPKLLHTFSCGNGNSEVILFEEEISEDDTRYFSFSLRNADNRLPGVGVYERLFKLQERANTLVNQNAEATAIASLLLLRTADPNTTGNVLQGAVSGQIITSQDLQQIGVDNRAFTILLNELDRIENQARRLCMTPDVVSGDGLPSSNITFRGQAVLTNAAKSAFKIIRDEIGMGVVNILVDHLLPSQIKKWNRGDIIEIAETDSDADLFDKSMTLYAQEEYARNYFAQTGKYPTLEELNSMAPAVENSIRINGRKLEYPKGFFNFKFGIKLEPTGETYDKAQQNDAYSNILTMIQTNPAIQNNPYFRQYVEDNGITPIRMKQEDMAMMMAGAQAVAGQQMGQKKDALSSMVDTTGNMTQ